METTTPMWLLRLDDLGLLSVQSVDTVSKLGAIPGHSWIACRRRRNTAPRWLRTWAVGGLDRPFHTGRWGTFAAFCCMSTSACYMLVYCCSRLVHFCLFVFVCSIVQWLVDSLVLSRFMAGLFVLVCRSLLDWCLLCSLVRGYVATFRVLCYPVACDPLHLLLCYDWMAMSIGMVACFTQSWVLDSMTELWCVFSSSLCFRKFAACVVCSGKCGFLRLPSPSQGASIARAWKLPHVLTGAQKYPYA